MNPKLPLLDLGNVVIKVDWTPFFNFLHSHAQPNHIKSDFGHNLTHSSLFYEFEFGNIGPKEFCDRVGALCGNTFNEADFFESFCAILPDWMPGMQQTLQQLSQWGSVYALSNTNEVHLSYLKKQFPDLTNIFTTIYASHELKMRKPYPGTYKEVTKRLACNPNKIIFFDDLSANVQGAISAGLKAHVFVDANQVLELLRMNASG
jgi:HAD superfamily hydrolase (TIGR01509 family)